MGLLVGSPGLCVGSLFLPFVDSKRVFGFIPRYFIISLKMEAGGAGIATGGDLVCRKHSIRFESSAKVGENWVIGWAEWWERYEGERDSYIFTRRDSEKSQVL